jgi:hypothetical protein
VDRAEHLPELAHALLGDGDANDSYEWGQIQQGLVLDLFGTSVAVAGDPGEEVLIGSAPWDDTGFVFESGSAYVFRRVGGNWVESGKLEPGTPQPNAYFGTSVALPDEGNIAVIGNRGAWSVALQAGAVEVFEFCAPSILPTTYCTAKTNSKRPTPGPTPRLIAGQVQVRTRARRSLSSVPGSARGPVRLGVSRRA